VNRVSCPRAFTIIELLLALFLTALLTAALSMMIGQAAQDRRAMLRPDAEPAWMVSVADHLERDLITARWWAGTDDRLVLIGLGRDGKPAHIEYHWQEDSKQTTWVRHENPLTAGGQIDENETRMVLALNPVGVLIGPYRYGEPPLNPGPTSTTINTPPRQAVDTSGGPNVSIVVNGQRVPLRALPDQIELAVSASFTEGKPRSVTRKVVLR
jgi:hypothetical protein